MARASRALPSMGSAALSAGAAASESQTTPPTARAKPARPVRYPFAQGDPGHAGHDQRQKRDHHARLGGCGQPQGVGFEQKIAAGFAEAHQQQGPQVTVAAQIPEQAGPEGHEDQAATSMRPAMACRGVRPESAMRSAT